MIRSVDRGSVDRGKRRDMNCQSRFQDILKFRGCLICLLYKLTCSEGEMTRLGPTRLSVKTVTDSAKETMYRTGPLRPQTDQNKRAIVRRVRHYQSIIVQQTTADLRTSTSTTLSLFIRREEEKEFETRNVSGLNCKNFHGEMSGMMRVLIRRTIKLKAEAAGFLLLSNVEGFNQEESGPAQNDKRIRSVQKRRTREEKTQ